MITLRWSLFLEEETEITSYNVYRCMIGLMIPYWSVEEGSTITLKINNGDPVTLVLPKLNTIQYINANLPNATAKYSWDGEFIIIRSNIKTAPGSIQVLTNSLGIPQRTITEGSEELLVEVVTSSKKDDDIEVFVDRDGDPDDHYAISSNNSEGKESLKTPWRKSIPAIAPICVIEGVIADIQGVVLPDVEVIATLHETPRARSLAYITKEPVRTITAPDGRFSLPLLQGILVKLEIPAIGYSQMVTIPKRPYIFLQELLVNEEYTYPLGYR